MLQSIFKVGDKVLSFDWSSPSIDDHVHEVLAVKDDQMRVKVTIDGQEEAYWVFSAFFIKEEHREKLQVILGELKRKRKELGTWEAQQMNNITRIKRGEM